jgi:hypothetical protein
MPLETLSQSELQQARPVIIKVIAAYEWEILREISESDPIIDTNKLAEIRDKIKELRGILRDIASAESKLTV